ncbi:MAG: cytochrome c, partial [Proteobacteria bacterium]|nr:cytochrome c [Pseudomonadota bacterium]
MKTLLTGLACAVLAWAAPTTAATRAAPELYAQHCLGCHGTNRLGGMGPALLPESLERLKRKDAIATLRDGRVLLLDPRGGSLRPEPAAAAIAVAFPTGADPA